MSVMVSAVAASALVTLIVSSSLAPNPFASEKSSNATALLADSVTVITSSVILVKVYVSA